MKILLLNPPDENTVIEHPDEGGDAFLETEAFGYFPPLGALYVLSHLQAHSEGHELFFLDCVGERVSQAELPGRLAEIRPDVCGITSFTISLMDVVLAARAVRAANPDVHLCLGGHHPIAFPYESAQLPEFDSIVVGEGEVAFLELVRALEAGQDFTGIQGVYTQESIEDWRDHSIKDHRFLHSVTAPPAYIEDIDSIAPPNREFIQHIDYHSIVGITGKLATMITSRGCPYRCTFCDVPLKSYRARSPKHVVDEVEHCLQLGYEEVHFYDDLFNITTQRVLDICDEIDRRGVKFKWDFRGRVNAVSDEAMRRAKQSGCRMISFGVETGSDEGLKTLRKGTNTRKVEEAFALCKKHGIVTIADYMIGLPHERTRQDVLDNLDYLIGLGPDYAQFSILTLYPNTEVYRQALSKGLIEDGRWQAWVQDPQPGFFVDHWEEFLDIHELVDLQKVCYRKFYLRPSYMLKSLRRTESLEHLKIQLRGALRVLSFDAFLNTRSFLLGKLASGANAANGADRPRKRDRLKRWLVRRLGGDASQVETTPAPVEEPPVVSPIRTRKPLPLATPEPAETARSA